MQEIETIRRALSTANTNFYIDALEALAKLEAKLNKPVDVEKVSKAIYDAYYTDWDDETDRYKDFLRIGAFAAIAEIENQRL